MLTMINVGQGDAFIINPQNECVFSHSPLLVDTGPANAKVEAKIPLSGIDVLLTHSHSDHAGGLPALIKAKKITKIYLPYYLPEVSKIFGFLKKHIKIKLKPINWAMIRKLDFQFVAEGDLLCNHAIVLNPPRQPADFISLSSGAEISISQALSILAELGIELPRDEIENYRSPIFVDENREEVGYEQLARQFVHRFFIELSQSLAGATRNNINYYVTRKLELTSNETSIVFRYDYKGEYWLFTGDADEKVFERLISKGKDISAKYLKVPHHGSRGNLSEIILQAIKPEYAIISHKNGKFGKSKDTHPHDQVINLLDSQKICCYYTNPVIKNGVEIKKQTTGTILNGMINFIQ